MLNGRGGGWDIEEGPTAVTNCDIGVSFHKLLFPPLACRCRVEMFVVRWRPELVLR